MFTENTGVLYDANAFQPYMTIMREAILSLQKKLEGFTLISILNHAEC